MTTDPALSSTTGTGPLPGGPGSDPFLPDSEPAPTMPAPAPEESPEQPAADEPA